MEDESYKQYKVRTIFALRFSFFPLLPFLPYSLQAQVPAQGYDLLGYDLFYFYTG
jgi:hypothetical protein